MNSNSPSGRINWSDFEHACLHFAIAAAVSILIYTINDIVPLISYGSATALISPLVAFVAAIIKRYLTDYQSSDWTAR